MSEPAAGFPTLVFGVRIPPSSALGGSAEVPVQGHLALDEPGRPRIAGESCGDETREPGAWGSLSISWDPQVGVVRGLFSSGDDALSDFEFESSVATEDAAILRSSDAEPLAIARCLLAGAAAFEPFLPPADLLKAHPHMAQIISNQKK